ncbi:MAG: hypothetical protein M3Y86_10165 [Verrucomicrobiota bacterium]|nr:hypothetical protein [Verrucomicrobiota bacterium]
MQPFTPWEVHSSLKLNRLVQLAAAIKSARDSVVPLHDPDSGDNQWSMHCRGYARQCRAIRDLAAEVPWLTVSSTSPNDLELSFCVGSVPMKIVRGDPEDPAYRHRNFSAGEQMLMDALMVELPPGPLRLVATTNASGYVAGVFLVEFHAHTPVRYFEIPIDSSGTFVIPTPDPVAPVPIEPYDLPSEQQDSSPA